MLRTLKRTPLPVGLLILSLLCPTELSLYLGSLRLPPHRVALIVFSALAAWRLIRKHPIRIGIYDVYFLAYSVWTVCVFMLHLGQSDGLEFGGSLALESFGAYLVARVYIRSFEDFQATVQFLFAGMLLAAAIALPESIIGQHFVHEWLAKATGYVHPMTIEYRAGLTRAYSTFDHPILYGSFCASLFALLWYSAGPVGVRGRNIAAAGFATLLGLSSAPILCLQVQGFLMGYNRLTKGVPNRVWMGLGAFVVLYVVVEIFSSRPAIEAIVTRITFDPWTSYYRTQIWKYGLENVWANPVFGIGLADWARAWWMISASVDAYWLLIPMRVGLPGLILLLAAIWTLMRTVHDPRQRRGRTRGEQNASIGWTVSFIAIALAGLTVHYWNAMHAHSFLLLGMGGWLADPLPRRRAAAAVDGVVRPVRRLLGAPLRPATVLGAR